MSITTYSKDFINEGIGVIPVRYRHKEPDAFMLPVIDGDATWEPFKKTLATPELLGAWFDRGQHNYGVVAGWQDLVIIDFDDSQEYSNWLVWAMKARGVARFVATNAFKVQTSRGVHVYVRIPGGGTNRKAGKVDIKFRGYVLGPDSIHPSGSVYRALGDRLFFPQVGKLSDILPTHLLAAVEFNEIPERKTPAPVRAVAQVIHDDPWAAAWTPEPTNTGPKMGAVAKIKTALRIEQFFTDLTETGQGWLLTRCPFHDDSHPSFWVSTERQICNCFTCNFPKPLDVIDLYARLYGVSNVEAIRMLAQG